MTYSCAKGHASETSDYCSECGIRMDSGVPPQPANVSPDECPACSTPRTTGARFCEVCRFDFVAGRPSEPDLPQATVVEATPPTPPPVLPVPYPSAVPSGKGQAFDGPNLWVVVVPDRSLMSKDDAEVPFPDGEPKRSYSLDYQENTLGRRNARANFHPEIPVDDPSVSARHLKFCREHDGTLTVVDVGSSNGTRINGKTLGPGLPTPVGPDDRITVGLWTSITVESR